MWQYIIVFIIIAVCVYFGIRSVVKTAIGKENKCAGCSMKDKCDKAKKE